MQTDVLYVEKTVAEHLQLNGIVARGCTGDVCLMVCAQRDVHMAAALFVIADDSASDVHYDMT